MGVLRRTIAGVALASLVAAGQQPAHGQPADRAGRDDLRSAGGGAPNRVRVHRETGKVTFVGTEPGRPIPRERGADSPRRAAEAFVGRYGSAFGADAGSLEVQSVRRRRGGSVVRFRQLVDQVPVMAGDLAVQLDEDGDVLSAAGELLPRADVAGDPAVSKRAARRTALAVVEKERGTDGLSATTPELSIYSPALLGPPGGGRDVLVWRTSVASDDPPMRELVLVDAHRGSVVLHFDELAHSRVRHVCDNANDAALTYECTDDRSARSEGGAATGIVDVDRAYDLSGLTYDYFFTHFGRDGIDGRGMPMRSTVRFCHPKFACPYRNAFWTGAQMVFGDGYAVDDVMAHELTHGVMDYGPNLFYYYQSGAIDESLSDVFGELVDLASDAGDDTDANRWLIAEDLFSGGLRNMKDPPAKRHPDRMQSPLYADPPRGSGFDAGGVHTNSGVGNKAAVLIADGGEFNGRTVGGLGLDKTGTIYYEAASLLTSGSDYADLADALEQGCANRVGTSGITADDCSQVAAAVAATEMRLYPLTALAPEAPFCEQDASPTLLYGDGIEEPSAGRWQFSSGSPSWIYDFGYAHAGTRMLWGEDTASTSDMWVRNTAPVALPAGSRSFLWFAHAYQFEPPDKDGGVLEYSTDGGATWTDAGDRFTHYGYRGTISGTDNPLAGRPGFVDRSRGYISSRVDLTRLAGSSVVFRFRLGTDAELGDIGWVVDDVRVFTCPALLPDVRIHDAEIVEGDDGSKDLAFVVARSGPTDQATSASFATSDVTAEAGTDYAASSGSVVLPAGQTQTQIIVPVLGDVLDEPNETFAVDLSDGSGAFLADAQGIGKIVDDDLPPLPVIAIGDAEVDETDSGQALMTFTITRTGDTAPTSTVDFGTTNGTAEAVTDFVATNGTLTFGPGETTKTVTVAAIGDRAPEPDETFTVDLARPASATIGGGTGTGTIRNDDVLPIVSVGDADVREPRRGTKDAVFEVKLSRSSDDVVIVPLSTRDGSATAGRDFVATSMQVEFAPGITVREATVPVRADRKREDVETFYLDAAAPLNATADGVSATATIRDRR